MIQAFRETLGRPLHATLLPPLFGSQSSRGCPRARKNACGLLRLCALLSVGVSCFRAPATPDAALIEAIDWYTGVAGSVDDDRAKQLLEQAVERKGALAMMWLARVYSTGRMGFPRDQERARRIASGVIAEIKRAADAGVLEAVFLMGTAYDEGLGKPIDPAQAAVWHRRAAERGHVLGAHNLGNQYAAGRGLEQDYAQAAQWWLRAAEKGDAITQLRLGEAYQAGLGVPIDLEHARRWYGRAAALGNAQAREALRLLGR